MSSSDRRSLILALPAAFALAGCGFTPVYGPGGSARTLYGKVEVDAPTDRASYVLVRELEQRLGRPAPARYRLSVEIETDLAGQAVTATGDITRYNLTGRAAYTLTRIADGQVAGQGEVQNFAGYSATGSPADTVAAERDAEERLMVMLADQIVTRLVTLADISA